MNAGKALSAIALSIGILSTGAAYGQYQQGPPPPPPPGAYQNGPGGWDAPPNEFQDVQRRGFHDGIIGAQKDFENHRRPNVNNRDEYRHPQIEHGLRRAYKEGFRRGYDVGVQHMMGGGPGPRY